MCFDIDFDCHDGNPKLKEVSVKLVKDMMANLDLIDIWRIRNPNSSRYTWRQKKPVIQRRLDFWLISDCLQEDIHSVDIIPSIRSDHSAITLRIKSIEEYNFGPSFWKFNASLADDAEYHELISGLFPKWLEEFQEITDKRLLWDLIKYKIRQVTISYSKEKAKERRKKITELEKKLKVRTKNFEELPSQKNHEDLELSKAEYESYFDYIAQGTIIRSRTKWYEKGEKSNKFFLNLENRNRSKSCVRKIHLGDTNSKTTSNPDLIMKELNNYYSRLYSDPGYDNNDLAEFCNSSNIPKLTNELKILCEGRLSNSECFKSLQTFKNNKTPGNDGLSAEFYKCFWQLVGKFSCGKFERILRKRRTL